MKKENQYKIKFEIEILAESHEDAAKELKKWIEEDKFDYIVEVENLEDHSKKELDLSLEYPYEIQDDEPLTDEEIEFLKRQSNFMNEEV
jgi:hypothetical protein